MIWHVKTLLIASLSYAEAKTAPWAQVWRAKLTFRETLEEVRMADLRRSYNDIP